MSDGKPGAEEDSPRLPAVADPEPLPAPMQTVLETLPAENRGAVVAAFYQSVEFHRGPLPRPEDFGKYEKVLGGSANRIITMAEKEQNHRHNMESTIIGGETGYAARGQYIAGIIFVLLIAAGFYVIAIKGNNVGGGIILGATTLTAVGAFLGRQLGLFRDDEEDE